MPRRAGKFNSNCVRLRKFGSTNECHRCGRAQSTREGQHSPGLFKMTKLISNFVRNESGATAIEYGLIAALIAVVIIGAITAVGTSLQTTFSSVAGSVK